MSNQPRPDRLVERQKEGASRNEAWQALTLSQKLSTIDARLGKGVGATKQRKKLEGK